MKKPSLLEKVWSGSLHFDANINLQCPHGTVEISTDSDEGRFQVLFSNNEVLRFAWKTFRPWIDSGTLTTYRRLKYSNLQGRVMVGDKELLKLLPGKSVKLNYGMLVTQLYKMVF